MVSRPFSGLGRSKKVLELFKPSLGQDMIKMEPDYQEFEDGKGLTEKSQVGSKRSRSSRSEIRSNIPLTLRTNTTLFEQVRPVYYFDRGLRRVRPYYFEYQTYTKARWLGRSLLEVLQREFRDRPPCYYREAIERGWITLNGQATKLDVVLKSNDLLGHRLHRHEPPVTTQLPRLIHQGDGFLVVEKPASIPVHPSGRYRFNTLVEIIKNDWDQLVRKDQDDEESIVRGQTLVNGESNINESSIPPPQHLSLINRLDRLVSGVCIMATNSQVAERFHRQMEAGAMKKEYVARVKGRFPDGENGVIKCEAPLRVVAHKLGLVAVGHPDEQFDCKPAVTLFQRLATDGQESLVLCSPQTGRTHQIRVHLQYLGYPIINDHLYNNPIWPSKTKEMSPLSKTQLQGIARQLLDESMAQELEERVINPSQSPCNDEILVEGCPECAHPRLDPRQEDLCIYLHAWRYSTTEWSFETELPTWATIDK